MKKISVYFGIIAAAALTLVSCAKEIDNPNIVEEPTIEEGIPFEIVANPATKTTIAGLQTAWAADDGINLFHAVSGDDTYVDNGQFTIAAADLAAGTFKGTLASAPASGTYDWYAVYPYTSYLHNVNNTDNARFYIGSRSDQSQTQTGNSSTAHLAGSNYPLFGKVTGVAYDATPSITLSPIASFIEVKVTNKNESPLTVTNITFTAPDGSDIVGNYIIDFSTSPLSISKYSTYVSDAASLNVSGGAAIAKDAYATFYLAVKPFSTTSGDVIKVSVNGYEKNITTTKNFEFQAGKMKTVNFDYDAAPDPYIWVKTPIASLAADDVIAIVDENSSNALTSANGASAAPSVVSVSISSNKLSATPAEALQFVLEVPESGQYKFKAISTSKYIYTTNDNNGVRIGTNANNVFKWESNFLKNAATNRYLGVYNNQDWRCYTSTTGNIKDTRVAFFKRMLAAAISEYNITITAPSHGTVTTSPASKAEEGTLVTITATPDDGYVLSSLTVVDASSANVAVTSNQFSMPAKDVTITATFILQPSISKLKDSIDDVPAAGVSGEVEAGVYSLTNAVDGDVDIQVDGTVVTDAIVDGGSVMYDVAANAGGSRSGWIKLSVPLGNTIQIDVNQLGSGGLTTYTSTFTAKDWTSTGDFTWTSGADGGGFSNNGIQVTTTYSGANATTDATFTGVTSVVVTYNTNKSAGAGKLNVKIGTNDATEQSWAYSSGDGRTANYTCTFDYGTPQSGAIKLTATTTTNSIYIVSVAVTAAGCD